MSINTIFCQHLGLDQIPLFIGNGHLPNSSTEIAKRIIERATELQSLVEAYLDTLDNEHR
jgi:hypothetical protein